MMGGEYMDMTTPSRLADWRLQMVEMFGVTDFTCDNCISKFSCPYAFDPYNEDGDCLAEK